jgi:hypothetical protein
MPYFEEEQWQNWLNSLNEMFAEKEPVEDHCRTGTYPPLYIWPISFIDRHCYRCFQEFFPILLELLMPQWELSIMAGICK